MVEAEKRARKVSCLCGRVELDAAGAPIASVACYCDDCQQGARQIEARPHAGAVIEADGGTAYVVYRRDRVVCSRGAPLLEALKIRPESATKRVVASCCNTAMFLGFDDQKHWVSVYRARLVGEAPPLQMRVCTRFGGEAASAVGDVPAYPGYPLRFVARLVAARLAMWLGR